jgi:hypothetical protein
LRPLNIRLACLLLSMLVAFSSSAQTSDPERLKALEQKFNQSLGLIEQLQQRIAELERRPAAAPVASSVTAVTSVNSGHTPPASNVGADVSTRVETLERTVADLASSTLKTGTDMGLPLHGFFDAGYTRSNNNGPGYDRSGFRLGAFSIYLTPQLSDRIKGLVELAFEYGNSGELATDLERLQLGYVVTDNITLWAGRFHTPYGYWNTAFHHGAQIQTSITRPRIIAFEDQGGILPAHTVGAWATGKFDTGLGRVNYDVYAGNSSSLVDGTLNFNASGFDNQSPSVGFNVGISPRAVPGLTVGLHGLQHQVNSYIGGGGGSGGILNGQIDMQALGAYAFYESDRWEVIAEYYQFNNTDLLGAAGTNASSAGFVQGGYQFKDRWTGFARYEKASLNQNDPYFNLMNLGATQYGSSYKQHTVGLRYDLDPRTALKLQLEQIVDEGNASRSVNWLRAQYSVRF